MNTKITNTKITAINVGVKKHKAVLESKLNELLNVSGDREALEIQPTADPLDLVVRSRNVIWPSKR